MVRQNELPFLRSLLWQGDRERSLSEQEMLNAYERGWRFHDILAQLNVDELQVIKYLASVHGSWLEVECKKLLAKRRKPELRDVVFEGHKSSDVMSMIGALSADLMQDHGLALSGRTSLFAAIVGFNTPCEVDIALVNPIKNIKAFQGLIFAFGPHVLFEQGPSRSFVFGQYYFDQSGMWFNVRPSATVPAIKVSVHYEPRARELQLDAYKENICETLPSIAPNDELAFGLVDLSENAFSTDLMDDIREQVVFFSGVVSDFAGVIKHLKDLGVRNEELERILPQVFDAAGSSDSTEIYYSLGKDRLKTLMD